MNPDHSHTVAGPDRTLEYARQDGSVFDTGEFLPYGDLANRQEYFDHAGRPTSVNEWSSGRVDVFVGDDQINQWQSPPMFGA